MTYHNGPHKLTKADYRAAPGLSTSQLKAFAECPEGKPQKETDAMLFGTRLESIMFGAYRDIAIQPESIKVRRGKEWDAFQDEHPNADIIRAAEYDELQRAVDAIQANATADDLLNADTWLSFFWHDSETRVLRKAELDVLRPDIIVDLKTCADVSAQVWTRQAESLRYHWQAASYQDAVQSVLGVLLPVVFVCVANKPPYSVEIYEMDQRWIDEGLEEVRACIRRYERCRESGVWRSPTWGKIVNVSRPRWARYADDYSITEKDDDTYGD